MLQEIVCLCAKLRLTPCQLILYFVTLHVEVCHQCPICPVKINLHTCTNKHGGGGVRNLTHTGTEVLHGETQLF